MAVMVAQDTVRRPIRKLAGSVLQDMKRTLPLISIALAAAALTACGSGSQQAQKSSAAPASGKSTTVSLASVSGVGKVLVDSKGFALYSPKQDTSQMIRCTGSCTSIWVPLTVKGSPTADSNLSGKIGTAMRPDGRMQVTFNGKPLYTFAEDSSPKTVSGNGATDSFGGHSFTWHVASLGKTTAPSGGSGGSGGGYSNGY
jgi:predicted lipoprotein with Yx(FWY)xxD motif